MREPDRARLLYRLRELRENGVRIIFDCNFRPILWGSHEKNEDSPETNALPWYEKAIAASDIVFISRDEIRVLGLASGTESRDVCTAVRNAGATEAVLKDGGGYCHIATAENEVSVPARRLETVVDTTAAGDSFSAAYILGRHLGLSPEAAAAGAHVLAAAVVSNRGAAIPADAMPDVFPGTLLS